MGKDSDFRFISFLPSFWSDSNYEIASGSGLWLQLPHGFTPWIFQVGPGGVSDKENPLSTYL